MALGSADGIRMWDPPANSRARCNCAGFSAGPMRSGFHGMKRRFLSRRMKARFGLALTWRLVDALPRRSDRGLQPASVAKRLFGLIALRRRIGVDRAALPSMRLVVEHLRDQSASVGQLKVARLGGLMRRGGVAHPPIA